MKKLVLGIVVVISVFSLVACGEKNNDVEVGPISSGEQISSESGEQVLENMETEEQPEDSDNNDEESVNVDIVSILSANDWYCYKMTDALNNEIPMDVMFGSSYRTYPGSLTFYEDGTFNHFKPGISDGTEPTEGTYMIDGSDIYLTYSDEVTAQDGTVYIGTDETEIFLLAYGREETYKMYFKKLETTEE